MFSQTAALFPTYLLQQWFTAAAHLCLLYYVRVFCSSLPINEGRRNSPAFFGEGRKERCNNNTVFPNTCYLRPPPSVFGSRMSKKENKQKNRSFVHRGGGLVSNRCVRSCKEHSFMQILGSIISTCRYTVHTFFNIFVGSYWCKIKFKLFGRDDTKKNA